MVRSQTDSLSSRILNLTMVNWHILWLLNLVHLQVAMNLVSKCVNVFKILIFESFMKIGGCVFLKFYILGPN